MKKPCLLPLILLVSGCIASSVTPRLDDVLSEKAREFIARKEVSITSNLKQISPPGSGIHCFEPLIYVVTLGIIPVHCRDSYMLDVQISDGGKVESIEQPFEVTRMQGWLMAIYPLFPNWKYGSDKNAAERAMNKVLNDKVRN